MKKKNFVEKIMGEYREELERASKEEQDIFQIKLNKRFKKIRDEFQKKVNKHFEVKK